MSLKLNSSGGGSVTLQEPVTASTLTLNLPSTLGNTGNSMAVTSDASGNLGLGLAPAGQSGFRTLEIGGSGVSGLLDLYQGTTRQMRLYNSGSNINIANNTSGGSTLFINVNAGSGFFESMRIDSSGNLGLGTTLPFGAASRRALVVRGTANGAEINIQSTTATDGTSDGFALIAAGSDAYVYNRISGGFMAFGTSNTERARITSSGDLLVGTTVVSNNGGVGVKLYPSGSMSTVTAASTNASQSYYLYSTGVENYRFYVGNGGTIYATSTSISAISDISLKENVRDLETGLTEVMALRPRRFDWKNGDAQNVAGFVAQEVEEVLPELISDYVYNKDKEGNDIIKKSLKMGDILPTLVKAIQELKAEFDAYKATHP